MASTKEYLNFILEQLSDLDEVNFRAMMGEYIIYCKGRDIRIRELVHDERQIVSA